MSLRAAISVAAWVFCGAALAGGNWLDLPQIQSVLRTATSVMESGKGNDARGIQQGVLGPVGLEHCAQLFPLGKPLTPQAFSVAGYRAIGLCSDHFAVMYSPATKAAVFVVERLNGALLDDAKGQERTNEFFADPRLPTGARAELSDFAGSGLDRGHLANAADQPDARSMAQSFALSNMIPQDPENNRKGAWLKLERDTRKFARRAKGEVYVFSGPLFWGQPQATVGKGKVWVPSHLFKVVYDEAGHRAWAHIVANTPDAQVGKPVSYAEFVSKTGLDLLGAVPGIK
jgi:endonuclease G